MPSVLQVEVFRFIATNAETATQVSKPVQRSVGL